MGFGVAERPNIVRPWNALEKERIWCFGFGLDDGSAHGVVEVEQHCVGNLGIESWL